MLDAAADLDVTHLRGRIAGLIRASVLATLTEAQQAQLRGLLPESLQAFLATAPDPEGWIPTADLSVFLAAVQALTPLRTERSRARLQADLLLQGSPLLQGAGPAQVVASLPQVYADVHRGGRVVLEGVSEVGAEVLVLARYPYPSWYSEVLPAWLQQALTRAGAQKATVRHRPPGPGEALWRHRYTLRWKA